MFLILILAITGLFVCGSSVDARGVRMGSYQIKVSIESPERYRKLPYGIELDFDQLLKEQGIKGTFDRFSVVVKKSDCKTGKLVDVHYNLTDSFLYSNIGRVNWLIDDTNETDYVIFYDIKEHGYFAPPKYVGLVGNGDCLHFNDGKLHPLHVGMTANPVAVDWDGDGKTDIISPQIYTFTRESPRFCMRFFRNEGTNKKPFFGDGIPLRYKTDSGYSFIEGGLSVEVIDWNNDGLPDILSVPYGGGPISIYLNTGKKDEMGMPVLISGGNIPVSAGSYPYIKIVEWHGDGRKSVLVGYMKVFEGVKISDPLWFKATDEDKKNAQWPRWGYRNYIDYYENEAKPGEPLKLKPAVRLKTADGNDISWYLASSFECADWDSDGQDELLVLCNSDKIDKGYTGIRMYKNVGNASLPVFEDHGLIPGIEDRSFMYFRMLDTPAFKGLLTAPGSAGGKMRYYELQGKDSKGRPEFKSKGFIMQRNTYLNSYSGYAQASIADWDGDGGFDFTLGCETGWITRCADVGKIGWRAWSNNEFLKLQNKPLELLNGPWSDPGSFMEGVLGQTAPIYVDWDHDGVMDLIVAIGRKLLFYKNTGTSARPKLLPAVEIRTAKGNQVKVHRDKPAIVDWDGDGLLDIVGTNGSDECLFKRYRDEKTSELKLAEGVPIKFQDGTIMGALQGFVNAADWNGKGVYDLFSTGWDQVIRYENVGTNAQPVYLHGVNLEVDGKSISVGSHVTTPVPVDWDKTGRQDIIMTGESGLLHLFRRSYLDGVHNKIKYQVEK